MIRWNISLYFLRTSSIDSSSRRASPQCSSRYFSASFKSCFGIGVLANVFNHNEPSQRPRIVGREELHVWRLCLICERLKYARHPPPRYGPKVRVYRSYSARGEEKGMYVLGTYVQL